MTDKAMLDILSTFTQATDESKPLTEGKRTVTADTAMADILGKLNTLNESAEPVITEGKMPSKKHVMDMCKDGKSEKEMLEMHADADKDKLKDLIKTCKEEMKDSKEEMDEASCGSSMKKKMKESAIAEGVAQIEQRLLKEFAEFAEAKQELEEEPNEGNEFSGALAQAKKDGKEEFEVDGKTYKVTEMFDKQDEVGSKKKTKHGTLEKTATGVKHTRDYKPDYLDLDGDGDKKEPMKKAAKDKKAKEKK